MEVTEEEGIEKGIKRILKEILTMVSVGGILRKVVVG
jgi:hypothetical protein